MKVQCNPCGKLYEFKKHITISKGFLGWQSKEVELCPDCEMKLWAWINRKTKV